MLSSLRVQSATVMSWQGFWAKDSWRRMVKSHQQAAIFSLLVQLSPLPVVYSELSMKGHLYSEAVISNDVETPKKNVLWIHSGQWVIIDNCLVAIKASSTFVVHQHNLNKVGVSTPLSIFNLIQWFFFTLPVPNSNVLHLHTFTISGNNAFISKNKA